MSSLQPMDSMLTECTSPAAQKGNRQEFEKSDAPTLCCSCATWVLHRNVLCTFSKELVVVVEINRFQNHFLDTNTYKVRLHLACLSAVVFVLCFVLNRARSSSILVVLFFVNFTGIGNSRTFEESSSNVES